MRLLGFGFGSVALFLIGCEPTVVTPDKSGDNTDDPADSGALEEIPIDSGDSENTGTGDGIIAGTVKVSLYSLDEDGELVWEDWASTYGEDFPFGSIFVAAYTLDETTQMMTYADQYVVRSPDPEGNSYQMQVDPEMAPNVRVYAVLDYWGDGILATDEPMGVWPDEIAVEAGVEVDDIDIDIPAPYYDFTGGGGGGGNPNGVGGGGGGGGSWNPEDYVLLSGDGLITESYAGGSCTALLYDGSMGGPYYADGFTPVKDDVGATGTYSMYLPKNYGTAQLLGAWDSNYNGLIDPADKWGQYVDETGAAANPITVADVDLPDHTLMIPDGTGINPSLVPFVTLSGEVTIDGGFDGLASGESVTVAAFKYRIEGEFLAADTPANAYDYQTWTADELSGSSQTFTLVAPANTIVYMWAYIDTDGDGWVNEEGEPVASYGDPPAGRVATGTTSHAGIELLLQNVEF